MNAYSSEADRAYQLYKQEYTLLPTQRLFKVEQYTEYERDELLKKWELDKLLQQRKESLVEEEKAEARQSDPVKTMMEPPALRQRDSAEPEAQGKEFEV